MSALPLSDVRVLDLTRLLPGGFCSLLLADLGAEVLKVEDTGMGDYIRWSPPYYEGAEESSRSALFLALNRNKRSIRLNLKSDEGKEVLLKLVREHDVVLESFRPGVAERLGIGPETVSDRAIYCSITGFGRGGRHEQRAGHDLNYVGWAGLLADTAPALPPVLVADLAAGALGAVTEILAALLLRERTGRGAHVVVSMTHGSHALAPRTPVLTQGFACYTVYDCADGRRLTVAALEPKFFARLCELLERPELAAAQYDVDQPALVQQLAGVFAQRPLADWLRLFETEDVCVGPVATLA
jgi:alpha-methylacyl-CoA racemase